MLFVGCATQSDRDSWIESWTGTSKNDLMLAYGAPSQIIELDGGSELVEFYHERMYDGTSFYCTLRFVVSPEKEVVSGKADGNPGDCNRLIKER